MLCWALKANFTNCSRFTTNESSFHDMAAETPRTEMKSVTHVYAQSVTHVRAPCREEPLSGAGSRRDVRIQTQGHKNSCVFQVRYPIMVKPSKTCSCRPAGLKKKSP